MPCRLIPRPPSLICSRTTSRTWRSRRQLSPASTLSPPLSGTLCFAQTTGRYTKTRLMKLCSSGFGAITPFVALVVWESHVNVATFVCFAAPFLRHQVFPRFRSLVFARFRASAPHVASVASHVWRLECHSPLVFPWAMLVAASYAGGALFLLLVQPPT